MLRQARFGSNSIKSSASSKVRSFIPFGSDDLVESFDPWGQRFDTALMSLMFWFFGFSTFRRAVMGDHPHAPRFSESR
jgi:hypothetical protein